MSTDVHELTGAYALGAVEDDVERRRFEQHLRGCPPCRQEVRSFVETTTRFAETVAVAPPPGLRARVLAEVDRTPQLPAPSLFRESGRRAPDRDRSPDRERRAPDRERRVPDRDRRAPDWDRRGWGRSVPGPARRPRATGRPRSGGHGTPGRRAFVAAAAVALVVAGGGLAGIGALYLENAREARQQAERILALAGDPAAQRATGPVTGGGRASVVIAGDQAAVVVDGAQALAGDRAYQLWLIRPGAVVPAGMGPAGADGGSPWSRLITGVRAGDRVAISVEPAAGSRRPTTTPVAVLGT